MAIGEGVGSASMHTLDSGAVLLWRAHEHGGGGGVEGVGRVGVQQQLRQEGLEHVLQVCASAAGQGVMDGGSGRTTDASAGSSTMKRMEHFNKHQFRYMHERTIPKLSRKDWPQPKHTWVRSGPAGRAAVIYHIPLSQLCVPNMGLHA